MSSQIENVLYNFDCPQWAAKAILDNNYEGLTPSEMEFLSIFESKVLKEFGMGEFIRTGLEQGTVIYYDSKWNPIEGFQVRATESVGYRSSHQFQ